MLAFPLQQFQFGAIATSTTLFVSLVTGQLEIIVDKSIKPKDYEFTLNYHWGYLLLKSSHFLANIMNVRYWKTYTTINSHIMLIVWIFQK